MVSMEPTIAGVVLHAYVDILTAMIIFRIAYEYRSGTFSKLFALLGCGFLVAGLMYQLAVQTAMWMSEIIHSVTILIFIAGFYWMVMKYRAVLLPAIKGLK